MNVFFDPQIIAVSFIVNLVFSFIKPFIKIESTVKSDLVCRLIVCLLGVVGAYFYHKLVPNQNGLFIDACIVVTTSTVIYHWGYNAFIDKIKEKLNV